MLCDHGGLTELPCTTELTSIPSFHPIHVSHIDYAAIGAYNIDSIGSMEAFSVPKSGMRMGVARYFARYLIPRVCGAGG
jgi:hypothetical protein